MNTNGYKNTETNYYLLSIHYFKLPGLKYYYPEYIYKTNNAQIRAMQQRPPCSTPFKETQHRRTQNKTDGYRARER